MCDDDDDDKTTWLEGTYFAAQFIAAFAICVAAVYTCYKVQKSSKS
jgi:hypothetical protein